MFGTFTTTTTFIFTHDFDVDIRFNQMNSNGDAGLAWLNAVSMFGTQDATESLGPGTTFITLNGEIEGNVMVENSGAGVVMAAVTNPIA